MRFSHRDFTPDMGRVLAFAYQRNPSYESLSAEDKETVTKLSIFLLQHTDVSPHRQKDYGDAVHALNVLERYCLG